MQLPIAKVLGGRLADNYGRIRREPAHHMTWLTRVRRVRRIGRIVDDVCGDVNCETVSIFMYGYDMHDICSRGHPRVSEVHLPISQQRLTFTVSILIASIQMGDTVLNPPCSSKSLLRPNSDL